MTHTRLVADLEAEMATLQVPGRADTAPRAAALAALIADARAGKFHDDKSPHAAPKHELVQRLCALNLRAYAHRVVAGKYDEEHDDEACAHLK